MHHNASICAWHACIRLATLVLHPIVLARHRMHSSAPVGVRHLDLRRLVLEGLLLLLGRLLARLGVGCVGGDDLGDGRQAGMSPTARAADVAKGRSDMREQGAHCAAVRVRMPSRPLHTPFHHQGRTVSSWLHSSVAACTTTRACVSSFCSASTSAAACSSFDKPPGGAGHDAAAYDQRGAHAWPVMHRVSSGVRLQASSCEATAIGRQPGGYQAAPCAPGLAPPPDSRLVMSSLLLRCAASSRR